MSRNEEQAVDVEPPPTMVSDEIRAAALVDRVMAIAHLPDPAHVAVIGHRTLPLVLALLRRGCRAVRSLRPDAPSPDCEPAELAWIIDPRDEHELDGALRAARWRAGRGGRVILEGAACRWCHAPATVRNNVLAAGLDVVSFDHVTRRLVLAPSSRVALAA